MKRYISAVLAATLIAGLTACGGGATTASTTSTSAAASPSTNAARAVPDVTGVNFQDARTTLINKDFAVHILSKDGEFWTGSMPGRTVMVLSTNPAAGAVTDTGDINVTVDATEPGSAAASQKAAADAAAAAAAAAEPTGLAATLPKKFPGYPRSVHGASLDYRVASWFKGKLVKDQVVALIPGVYTPYNPNVKDLLAYYENGGDGDSVMRSKYMPETGGAGWPGVLPGAEEPK